MGLLSGRVANNIDAGQRDELLNGWRRGGLALRNSGGAPLHGKASQRQEQRH
jgi:hypothetical protein